MAKVVIVKTLHLGKKIAVHDKQSSPLSSETFISLKSVPTIYDQKGRFVEPVNHWFIYLKSVKRLEDINSYSRALLRYWNFLEKNNLFWDQIPSQKMLKPTYLFRNTELIPAVKEGQLKSSTANTYIRHLVQFYSWAIYEKIIRLEPECLPFQVEFVNIKAKGMLSHLQSTLHVQTHDLRIREPNRYELHETKGLNPLNLNELKILLNNLNKVSLELNLMILLACCSGLRASEVCSLTIESINTAKPTSDIKNRFIFSIGPKYGVKTKYLKERRVEISAQTLKMIKSYIISERRLNRLILNDNKSYNFEPIFISQQGNRYSTASLSARWGDLRKLIKQEYPLFNFKFHDLRSTYATHRISELLDAGISEYDAIDTLMEYLGHNQEATMWKYIRYKKRKEAICDKFTILDKLIHEFCAGD
ncbi:tyrosine-type recombinase/integrase [Photobacterium damselae]|uniref:tyrosine-type recombinase/integrase n=1 Tax=Photobacterium damselae TaxID=38293 RepID=UPI004068C8D4